MGISTHILDLALGRPATGVPVLLSLEENGVWTGLAERETDQDGRCQQLLPEDRTLAVGTYRIRFATAVYYETQQVQGLYPYVELTFTVTDSGQHYHIPLLLTANGFTTYRGS